LVEKEGKKSRGKQETKGKVQNFRGNRNPSKTVVGGSKGKGGFCQRDNLAKV